MTDEKLKELVSPENFKKYAAVARPSIEASIKGDFALKELGRQQNLKIYEAARDQKRRRRRRQTVEVRATIDPARESRRVAYEVANGLLHASGAAALRAGHVCKCASMHVGAGM